MQWLKGKPAECMLLYLQEIVMQAPGTYLLKELIYFNPSKVEPASNNIVQQTDF